MKLVFACLAILQLSFVVGCPQRGTSGARGGGRLSDVRSPAARNNCRPAKIRLHFQSGRESGPVSVRSDFECAFRGPPIAVTSGRIMAAPGSDASVLLRRLQKTLEAKTVPMRTKRVAEIHFDAAIIGTNNSHAKDGGFFTEPPGNWTAMKIFIGNKNDPAEVFLNFNPILRKGEFSIKDADYGDDVLRELAKVL